MADKLFRNYHLKNSTIQKQWRLKGDETIQMNNQDMNNENEDDLKKQLEDFFR